MPSWPGLNAHLSYLPDESRVNHWKSARDGRVPFLAVAPVLARRRLSGAGYWAHGPGCRRSSAPRPDRRCGMPCSGSRRRRWRARPPCTTRSAPSQAPTGSSTRCGSAAPTSCCRCCARTWTWTGPPTKGPIHCGPARGVAAVSRADLVIVPALAVDRRGMRLGRGGGSYDRALARVGPQVPTIALLYDAELLDEVPDAPHDQRVRLVARPQTGITRLPYELPFSSPLP